MPRIPSPTLLLLLLACSPDPEKVRAQAYVDSVQPILVENMDLSHAFLKIAGKVKSEEIDAKAINTRFTDEILPAARKLQEDAEAIEPEDPELASTHEQLVNAWTHRTEAYTALEKAYGADDRAGFKEASDSNLAARYEEEQYFAAVNKILAPYGLYLDQFPD